MLRGWLSGHHLPLILKMPPSTVKEKERKQREGEGRKEGRGEERETDRWVYMYEILVYVHVYATLYVIICPCTLKTRAPQLLTVGRDHFLQRTASMSDKRRYTYSSKSVQDCTL